MEFELFSSSLLLQKLFVLIVLLFFLHSHNQSAINARMWNQCLFCFFELFYIYFAAAVRCQLSCSLQYSFLCTLIIKSNYNLYSEPHSCPCWFPPIESEKLDIVSSCRKFAGSRSTNCSNEYYKIKGPKFQVSKITTVASQSYGGSKNKQTKTQQLKEKDKFPHK